MLTEPSGGQARAIPVSARAARERRRDDGEAGDRTVNPAPEPALAGRPGFSRRRTADHVRRDDLDQRAAAGLADERPRRLRCAGRGQPAAGAIRRLHRRHARPDRPAVRREHHRHRAQLPGAPRHHLREAAQSHVLRRLDPAPERGAEGEGLRREGDLLRQHRLHRPAHDRLRGRRPRRSRGARRAGTSDMSRRPCCCRRSCSGSTTCRSSSPAALPTVA